jgi:formylglycine-generating enzyme required for sulfatase activity
MSRASQIRRIACAALVLALCGCARTAGKPGADTPAAVAQAIAMADIPAGRFVMGTDEAAGFQNGHPAHPVSVPAFRLGRYDVTFDQYDAFARATGRALPGDEGWGRGERPVIHVDWSDIQAFIGWLNTAAGRHFRLPSEAEWEYAARGGTTTLYWWGDQPDPNMANTSANTGRDKWEFTSPVGAFPANTYGLYEVLGNVWQVVADCRHPSYNGAPADGSAWTAGDCDSRVVRGGFYGSIRRGMQVAARGAVGEHFDSMGVGFRVAENAGK